MSVIYNDSNRQAIPRCLPYATACSLGLLRTIREQSQANLAHTADYNAEQAWINEPNISNAIELVGEALIIRDYNSSEAIKAAKHILNTVSSEQYTITQLARHFLDPNPINWEEKSIIATIATGRQEIARMKKSVRFYPINPITWCDLAIEYATLGQNDKAKQAINIALNMGKENRFVLRSAARCYMHSGEPDKALAILNRSDLSDYDPWIASAEIAIAESANIKSKCLRNAREMIEDDNMTPYSRSELRVSIGTIEIKRGSIKKAKKMMHKALIDPTENALAQIEWASSKFDIDFDDMATLRNSVPASYEASAVHLFYRKEFARSLIAAEKWRRFQFLSSRPLILSTFISSCLFNDDERTILIFENALPAQRATPLAVNNFAFALARLGRTEEARNELASIDTCQAGADEKNTITATYGLIFFRTGHTEEGRKSYGNAIRGFEKTGNFRAAFVARYYWAYEEKRIHSENAASIIKEAKKGIERYRIFELEELAKKL